MRLLLLLFFLFALFGLLAQAGAAPEAIRLNEAVVVTPASLTGPERQAVEMLVDEVAKRTQIRWPVRTSWPAGTGSVIAVGPYPTAKRLRAGKLASEPGPPGAEGYRIAASSGVEGARVTVLGADARGVLFGVGRLLRELRMERGSVTLPASFGVTSTPDTKLRGHQLGYRPKTNSYDGWDLRQWEQYYRDLAVFGCNTVELIPPRSDDAPDSPHFPLPQMEMMGGMSRVAAEYGLDVWIWYPAMDPDYAQPGTVEAALREWGEVFRRLPRVDAVFVPGGDPGHTEPRTLLALLKRQAANLRRYHPRAQMWVSPQSFDAEWYGQFINILRTEQPEWLAGVAYGPQVRVPLAQFRRDVPARYPIRNYPDITHCVRCQFPVPDWEAAYALTEGREPINPRPTQMARALRQARPDSIGFITYSEGCNDDVNKCVWSTLGWDAKTDEHEALRQYARYYIGPASEERFADGLARLEGDWSGPLASNASVPETLRLFQELERGATPAMKLNWRFQQALYRAYYDAWVQSRLRYENAALDRARTALQGGGDAAVAGAAAVLDEAARNTPHPEWRARLFELAEALFQSVRMQLSVERYQAIGLERGANLDSVDAPITDLPWLREQLAAIQRLPDAAERARRVGQLVHWRDPGPGGFYDALGDPQQRPHLLTGPSFMEDPEQFASVRTGTMQLREGPVSRGRYAETVYDTPLRMRYTGLDPAARYRVRVLYSGDRPQEPVRLETGDGTEIHPFMDKPNPLRPVEYEIPASATAGGTLELRWYGKPGRGGNGRGCAIGEVWLLRQ